MAQTRRPQHPNAALTPTQRLKMVRLVGDGWSVAAAAQRFQVDDKTTRKWVDRYRCEGEAGMGDRSSRPCHSPRRTPEPQRQRVIELRRRTRRGAGFIAHVCGMHASTVHRICVQAGLGRLDHGDRSCGPPPKPLRYEREKPGELVHVDVKKLPAIPDGGGWRTHGRGNAGPPPEGGLALCALRHRRPHPPGVLRDPHQRDRLHRGGVLEASRRLLCPRGDRLREGAHRQRPLLPLQRLPHRAQRHPHQPQAHPALPAPDQRQSRTFPPHPQRGMGLRPRLGQRHHLRQTQRLAHPSCRPKPPSYSATPSSATHSTLSPLRPLTVNCPWVPTIRSWTLTRRFALHPGTRNRYKIRYTRNQDRLASLQVNDHGRVPAPTAEVADHHPQGGGSAYSTRPAAKQTATAAVGPVSRRLPQPCSESRQSGSQQPRPCRGKSKMGRACNRELARLVPFGDHIVGIHGQLPSKIEQQIHVGARETLPVDKRLDARVRVGLPRPRGQRSYFDRESAISSSRRPGGSGTKGELSRVAATASRIRCKSELSTLKKSVSDWRDITSSGRERPSLLAVFQGVSAWVASISWRPDLSPSRRST